MLVTVLSIQTKKFYGKYNSDHISYKSPFEDRTVLIHHEVASGNFAEGYYLDAENNILYDVNYKEPVNTYQAIKYSELEDKKEAVTECITRFAAENSELLNLEIASRMSAGTMTLEEIPAFVRLHLDGIFSEMKDLMSELNGFHYWNVESRMDAIARDDLLRTDDRMNEWKTKILGVVR